LADRRVNYWDYIHVEELLALQSGIEGDEARLSDDEVLFITVHQVFELWFKLIVRELVGLRDLFKQETVAEQELSTAARKIKRIVVLFRRCADHFEVMETMTAREYLEFRDKLTPASGFQSAQMRQIEILMGIEEGDRIPLGTQASFLEALRTLDGEESPALARVRRQLDDPPSLRVAIEDWLYRTPIGGLAAGEEGADEALERFVTGYVEAQSSEIDLTCSLALARAVSEGEAARLRERYADEKKAIREFLGGADDEEGARRQRIRAACLFILSYRDLPLLAWPREVLDGLIELEQASSVFRQRHARMVERMIGRRTGTGGSSGVDYLDQTALRYRVFRDLWAARTHQIRHSVTPEPEAREAYGFRYE